MFKLFMVLGLIANILGSLILVWPYIFPKHYADDDLILKMNMKTGEHIQKKHLKERKINFYGFLFLGIGFLLQLIAVLI